MKTGIKRLIALLCALLIVLGLVGCGGEKELARVQATDFFTNFKEILGPIADQFEVNQTAQIDHEKGEIVETWMLTDTMLNTEYRLEVAYSADGWVRSVTANTKKGTRADMTFAVLSYYVYKAIGAKGLKPDAFYEKYNLLTAEPETTLENMELAPNVGAGASTFFDNIYFTIVFVDENAPE